MSEHGLGRIPSPRDERDYRMADALPFLTPAPRPVKVWHSDRVLNQGTTQHCVGFAMAAWGIACPVEDPWCDLTGHDIYKACKVLDGEPGNENGSTVRTGAKVLVHRGRIGTYFFARTVDEMLDYLARYGTVVAGTNWYSGMFKTSLMSHIIRPNGELVGGHAYLLIGVDARYITIRNSWGTDWGKAGDARISIADFRTLWAQGAEALAATEKLLPLGGS